MPEQLGLLGRCVPPEPVKDADPACAEQVSHAVRHILPAFPVFDVHAVDACRKVFREVFPFDFCSVIVSEL